jgi:oxaloacetate decarboxylase alpha subunit
MKINTKITEVVLRDGQQSILATRMKVGDMLPIIPKMDKVGFSSVEVWGGATYDCCLRYLNENPWDRLKLFKRSFKKTKLQMLLRGQNIVGYKKFDDSVVSLFIKNAAKSGIDIFRTFDSLNDISNIESSIRFINANNKHSQGTIAYTTSPIHNNKYWLKLAKNIEDIGASSVAIKDMSGLLRPYEAFDLITLLKKNLKIPIYLHTHATTGLSDATNLKAFEAGVDNIDTSISSFSGTYGHTATESFISMIYKDSKNPYDMNLLNEISEYFANIRVKYADHEGSLKGIDTKMLTNQVPGGMLSNFESQLRDLGMEEKLSDLINEIPKIRKDLGYIPLVTPSSQIVGTQALLNIRNSKRYESLTNEMVDLINGKYGKVKGKINKELKELIKTNYPSKKDKDLLTVTEHKKNFKQKCIDYELDDLYKNDKHLLNYILFPEVSIDYYCELKRSSEDFMIDLQQGLGIIID